MAINYLRRPPKPVIKKAAVRKVKRVLIRPTKPAPVAHAVEIEPEEGAALAKSLVYFCVACGREHSSDGVRRDDIACAEADITALIRRAP